MKLNRREGKKKPYIYRFQDKIYDDKSFRPVRRVIPSAIKNQVVMLKKKYPKLSQAKISIRITKQGYKITQSSVFRILKAYQKGLSKARRDISL